MEAHDSADAIAIYFLLVLGVLVGVFFVCVAIVLVRLCIYQGAIGPQPETFVIVPTYLRERAAQLESPADQRNKIHSMFPFPKPASPMGSVPGTSRLSHIPRINIAAVNINKQPDREVRAFFAEQQRISKLPTFVQDDCGDGSEFPDIPYADTRSGSKQSGAMYPFTNSVREMSATNRTLGLRERAFNEWLTVDTVPTKLHEARDWLLVKKNAECIQVTREGEAACEELLHEVANFLVEAHPTQYRFKDVFGRRQIRNELTREEYALVRPFDCHPLEVCARLVNEDFGILAKGEFTQQYYLQASATLAPAGLCMSSLIGKNLAQIRQQEVYQWDDLAEIVPLPLLSPLTRSTFYIQTQPDMRPLASLLFIDSSKDFFPGTIAHLLPSHILVRRETQTFRRLGSGAVVVSVRTDLRRLVELSEAEKKELLVEMATWSEEVARWRGKSLWECAVVGFCGGKLEMGEE